MIELLTSILMDLGETDLTSRCIGPRDVFVPTHRSGQEFAADIGDAASPGEHGRRSVLDAPLSVLPIALTDVRPSHASRPRVR